MNGPVETDAPPDTRRANTALPAGRLIGKFELRDAVHTGPDSIVYRAWDRDLGMAVAVTEHHPASLVRRLPEGDLTVASPARQADYKASLEAFVRISRALAHCDHPSLVRVLQLQFAHGTAYRVMPWIDGEPLSKLRRRMQAAPDETALRTLLGPLLGAVEALHATGSVHGAIDPGNVLMQRDGRPVLLSPPTPKAGGAGAASEPWVDLRGLAHVVRFMIDGATGSSERRVVDPAAAVIESLSFHDRRVSYGSDFLRAIDTAASPEGARRLGSVAGLRNLLRGALGPAVQRAPVLEIPAPVAPVVPIVVPPANLTPPIAPPAPSVTPVAPAAPVAPVARAEPIAADVIEFDAAPDYLRPPPPAAPRRGLRAIGAVATLAMAAGFGVWWGLQDGPPAGVTRSAEAVAPAPAQLPPPPIAEAQPAAVAAPASATAAAPVADAAAASAPSVAAAPAVAPTAVVAAGAAPQQPEANRAQPPAPPPAQAAPRKQTAAVAASSKPVRRTTAPKVAATQSPLQACGARTEFSLYRCMQQQCDRPALRRHAQCVRFRATDQVG